MKGEKNAQIYTGRKTLNKGEKKNAYNKHENKKRLIVESLDEYKYSEIDSIDISNHNDAILVTSSPYFPLIREPLWFQCKC